MRDSKEGRALAIKIFVAGGLPVSVALLVMAGVAIAGASTGQQSQYFALDNTSLAWPSNACTGDSVSLLQPAPGLTYNVSVSGRARAESLHLYAGTGFRFTGEAHIQLLRPLSSQRRRAVGVGGTGLACSVASVVASNPILISHIGPVEPVGVHESRQVRISWYDMFDDSANGETNSLRFDVSWPAHVASFVTLNHGVNVTTLVIAGRKGDMDAFGPSNGIPFTLRATNIEGYSVLTTFTVPVVASLGVVLKSPPYNPAPPFVSVIPDGAPTAHSSSSALTYERSYRFQFPQGSARLYIFGAVGLALNTSTNCSSAISVSITSLRGNGDNSVRDIQDLGRSIAHYDPAINTAAVKKYVRDAPASLNEINNGALGSESWWFNDDARQKTSLRVQVDADDGCNPPLQISLYLANANQALGNPPSANPSADFSPKAVAFGSTVVVKLTDLFTDPDVASSSDVLQFKLTYKSSIPSEPDGQTAFARWHIPTNMLDVFQQVQQFTVQPPVPTESDADNSITVGITTRDKAGNTADHDFTVTGTRAPVVTPNPSSGGSRGGSDVNAGLIGAATGVPIAVAVSACLYFGKWIYVTFQRRENKFACYFAHRFMFLLNYSSEVVTLWDESGKAYVGALGNIIELTLHRLDREVAPAYKTLRSVHNRLKDIGGASGRGSVGDERQRADTDETRWPEQKYYAELLVDALFLAPDGSFFLRKQFMRAPFATIATSMLTSEFVASVPKTFARFVVKYPYRGGRPRPGDGLFKSRFWGIGITRPTPSHSRRASNRVEPQLDSVYAPAGDIAV